MEEKKEDSAETSAPKVSLPDWTKKEIVRRPSELSQAELEQWVLENSKKKS